MPRVEVTVAELISTAVKVPFRAMSMLYGKRNRALRTLILGMVLTQHLAAQETAVPFELCARSDTWTRPSIDLQSKIWNDPRYSGTGPDAVQWTHSFIPSEPDSASISYSNQNLSGVWTDAQTNRCHRRDGEYGKWVEIWALNYHVINISLKNLVYTIRVVPSQRGYEIIQLRRPEASSESRATLRFVGEDRKTLEEWMEPTLGAFVPR
jgi:hypothetical protein